MFGFERYLSASGCSPAAKMAQGARSQALMEIITQGGSQERPNPGFPSLVPSTTPSAPHQQLGHPKFLI